MIRTRAGGNIALPYYPRLVPVSAIRRYVREIVTRFRPDKIILFGSYAHGTATADSDVDLLVVMPTRNQIEQAVRIDEAIEDRRFALDLLVRTPKTLANQLRLGDCFMTDIVECGKVLYEKDHETMDPQSRARHPSHSTVAQSKGT
jgi:predicted nucleotidyltransferase